ncbi:MAG: aspartate aminotransferase family protein, partial [Acidimicrobiales bacterium]
MDSCAELLRRAAEVAAEYRASLPERPVAPAVDIDKLRAAFDGPLPAAPTPPAEVLEALATAAEGGLVATAGPRFFGFVIGGSLPAATAAEVVAAGWDQVAFNPMTSPAAAMAEEVAGGWLKELLGLPATASTGFVTGAQAANTVGLGGGRHAVLVSVCCGVEIQGLVDGAGAR